MLFTESGCYLWVGVAVPVVVVVVVVASEGKPSRNSRRLWNVPRVAQHLHIWKIHLIGWFLAQLTANEPLGVHIRECVRVCVCD